MAEAAQPIPRTAPPTTSGLTMEQLVEKGGDKLFDYLDEPESGASEPKSPPSRAQPPAQDEEQQLRPPLPQEGEEEATRTPEEQTLDVLEDLGLLPEKVASETTQDPDAQQGDTPTTSVDLQQLSKTLGVDPENLVLADGQIRVRTKVDGVVEDKSLPEVLKGYQLQEHNTRTGMQLAQEREQWQAQKQQQEQQLHQQLQVAGSLLQQEEQALVQRYQAVDWDSLRAADPAQYAALQADYGREVAQAQSRRQHVEGELHRLQGEYSQRQHDHLQSLRDKESAALREAMGWNDDTAKVEKAKIVKYLTNGAGFQESEAAQIFDHRVGILADKAMKWDDLNKRLKATRQQVAAKQVHKQVTGGATNQGKGEGQKSRLKGAKAALAKSGSVEDGARVIEGIFGAELD